MTVRELIKLIEDDGWYHIKTKGSHRQFIVKSIIIFTLARLGNLVSASVWDCYSLKCEHIFGFYYKHPTKKGKVTVPGKMGKDVPKGTHNSVLKQAGLKS